MSVVRGCLFHYACRQNDQEKDEYEGRQKLYFPDGCYCCGI